MMMGSYQDNDSHDLMEDSGEERSLEEVREDVSPESEQSLLQEKDEEIKRLQDRILRLAAETENTRKRLEREKADGINFANESLLRELLPVIDNLERAISHGTNGSDCAGLLEGVRMTLKSFEDALGKFGCTAFNSVGLPFDPQFHEAVMQQESAEHPDKTVLQELQKGYMLRDRLIRPALVIVSRVPAGGNSTEEP